MKLKDLFKKENKLNEVNVFQNNYIKVQMIEDNLKKIFVDNVPPIKYDDTGMYIKLDNMLYREIENNPMETFQLTAAGFENEADQAKGLKKYYVEYIKIEKNDNPSTTEEAGDAEETPTE